METGRQGLAFRSGVDPAVQIDAVNENGQRCRGTLGVPGTDNDALAYKMECNLCGFVYGANGGDVFERKCPNCQGGEPGIRFWLVRSSQANGAQDHNRGELVAEMSAADWLDQISGTFKDEPEFKKVLEYGREFRQADRPTDADES